jgi:hypothetical protein
MKFKARIQKLPSREFINRANALPREEIQRRLAQFRLALSEKFDVAALSEVDAVALGLQIEEEQLYDWRNNMKRMRERHAEQSEGQNTPHSENFGFRSVNFSATRCFHLRCARNSARLTRTVRDRFGGYLAAPNPAKNSFGIFDFPTIILTETRSVNPQVPGSSPGWGAKNFVAYLALSPAIAVGLFAFWGPPGDRYTESPAVGMGGTRGGGIWG